MEEQHNYSPQKVNTMLPAIFDRKINVNAKIIALIVVLVLVSNLFTVSMLKLSSSVGSSPQTSKGLYLLDQASIYVHDTEKFEKKVKEISRKLDIPAEWLMAVMYSESKFDASITNLKGNGAVGLLQWLPETAKQMDITVEKIRNLNHLEQLDYVHKYLDQKRKDQQNFESLTDLYLAVLYPQALGEDYCYALYVEPTEPYKNHTILDENKDGRVTVKDIDDRMKRMFPTAYMAEKGKRSFWALIGF